jgi:hypothetical protein
LHAADREWVMRKTHEMPQENRTKQLSWYEFLV